jgi:hypothetical protein
MYFIMIGPDTKLKYFCRNCSHIDETSKPEEVFSKVIEDNTASSYEHVINQYTKYDPTLPYIMDTCQNKQCRTNQVLEAAAAEESQKNAKIVYLRYDQDQMKFVFLCTICDHSWILTK